MKAYEDMQHLITMLADPRCEFEIRGSGHNEYQVSIHIPKSMFSTEFRMDIRQAIEDEYIRINTRYAEEDDDGEE